MKKYSETAMKYIFMASATVSIIAVIVICAFLFSKGFPTIAEIGVFDFLGGTTWKPLEGEFGIFPMILGSIYVTAGAHHSGCSHRHTLRRFHGKVLSQRTV